MFVKKQSIMTQRYSKEPNRCIDYFFMGLLCFIVVLPLAAIFFAGINHKMFAVITSKEFIFATLSSFKIAITSGITSMAIAGGLLFGSFITKYNHESEKVSKIIAMLANFSLLVSPFILATGIFILSKKYLTFVENTFFVVVIVNALSALPFVVGIMYQSVLSLSKQEIFLCRSFNIHGYNFFRIVLWHKIKRPAAYALAIAIAMSWGDINIISLFGNENIHTLPLILHENIVRYKTQESAVIGSAILLLSFLTIWLAERLVKEEQKC